MLRFVSIYSWNLYQILAFSPMKTEERNLISLVGFLPQFHKIILNNFQKKSKVFRSAPLFSEFDIFLKSF